MLLNMAFQVGLFLLMLYGSTVCDSQSPVSKVSSYVDFGFVPQPTYETSTHYEPGPIGVLYHMAKNFLHMVQPNPFPVEILRKIAEQKLDAFKNNYNKVLQYELGFIICASLGVLFIIFMPVVGLCFCICRCCDNCGGEMHQRQKKNAECMRGCFASGLLVVSVLMSAGVICAYVCNQSFTDQIKEVKVVAKTSLKDLEVFLDAAPGQVEYLLDQYNTSKNKAFSDIENFEWFLGSKLQARLGKTVVPAIEEALSMAQAIRETKVSLEEVIQSHELLQKASNRLQANLTDVRTSMRNTLNDSACSAPQAAIVCNAIGNSLSQLNINSNFSSLENLRPHLASINDVLKTDLTALILKGYAAFNDTSKLARNQTKDVLSDIKKTLDTIGLNITSFYKQLPLVTVLPNLTRYVIQSEEVIMETTRTAEQYDFYRWLGFAVLCCTVVLILAFNYLGLLFGTCGYDRHISPTSRGCISNTGGNLLMAGVGFSFIFSWLLMSVVVVTFILAGNVEKLICEPFADKTLFKLLDTPYLLDPHFKNILPGVLFQNSSINLTFHDVYSGCKQNKGIYSALKFDHFFNISEILNIPEYTQNLISQFDSINVNLSGIVLLEDEGRKNLWKFSKTGVATIKFTAFMTEINKTVTKMDLLLYANTLEAQANQLPKGALENAFRGHANRIRSIHGEHVVPLEQSVKTLKDNILILEDITDDLPRKVGAVVHAIDTAQKLITHDASSIVLQEIRSYMDTILNYFVQYGTWVLDAVNFEVAACKPIANVADASNLILCSYVVAPLSGIWFTLGWCAVLLIPSTIFAVKLAKFYRRMDTEDVYDDNIIEQW
ncbi:prominin-1-A-like isoform X2 [Latimeria chalumnae]|uniref:prominin-1-A-like isoform X2 n=1 Tax=Latimeria chalumnae TaxID=7897 RepID=UPI00313EB08B